MLRPIRLSVILISCTVFFACNRNQNRLFTQLSADKTGIHFANIITEDNADTTLISEFAYMGGGVGIGDFNKDGLKDIFFSANQQSSRLYINKGDHRFEDVTERAGVTTAIWATGVSILDINNDGYDDIYVCAFGKNLVERTKNLLFINQKNLTFKEEAEAYGLADTSYSTQASFFDYDKDGDLDMYLLNYRLNGPNANLVLPKDLRGTSSANDRLYRNDGDSAGTGHPHFTDVSKEAGIKEDGYGLGVSVSDYNGDNWPDVYVSNDFVSNDVLWLNNKNGTFTNCIKDALRHQSYSSMGSDAADMNNDALPDLATVDMMPEYNDRKKLSYSFMNYERYENERAIGYEPEFMRNMLQLNNGIQKRGDTALPFFSEIGQMAGMSETDWSWSVLMADFDNDGWKDMHITNGIGRDYINADFVQFRVASQNFYEDKEQRKMMNEELRMLEHVELGNYLYLNKGGYTFADHSQQGGIDEASLSSGAAYADLDNDGDLDLVVNNINKKAFVFVNNTIQEKQQPASHFLGVSLKGEGGNPYGFGTKVFAYYKGKVQLQEQAPVRGYLSSVDRTLIFGLGEHAAIDSLVLVWPNDKKQTIHNVKADSVLTCFQKNADADFTPSPIPSSTLFAGATMESNIHYKHEDYPMNDFALQRLLPQKYSQLGPFLTTGDMNKDGLTDFYAGGGFNSSGRIFLQKDDGTFVSNLLSQEKFTSEDADCTLFDADGDGDQDLFISGGDTRFNDTSHYYIPRLYTNDGEGNFSLDTTAIPSSVKAIGGAVLTADFDEDGDLDIFLGSRVAKQYPQIPTSYLLQNNGGKFADATQKLTPQLSKAGMVTAAVWTDIDNDKKEELIIAGEWMPLRFFKNNKGQLKEITETTGLRKNSGMWRSLIAADVDKDGDMDLVAGNLGQNCKYHITAEEPMKLFAKDIDGNGSIDPVSFYYIRNRENKKELYPAVNRDMLAEQVPGFKKKFLKHKDFASAGFDDIFSNREGLTEYSCEETSSCYFENKGDGKFVKHLLPAEAQFAPVNAIICEDLDDDGRNDLLLAGNEYQTEVMTGRYDASYGCFLKGTANGFVCVPSVQSGFIVNGDVKDMKMITTKENQKLVIVAVNNDSLRTFRSTINGIRKD
jgi:hypothetical protein